LRAVVNNKWLYIRLLKSLNKVFSLKDLEEVLGISSQSLWRYIHGVKIPSRKTLARLAAVIMERRVIASALQQVLSSEDEEPLEKYFDLFAAAMEISMVFRDFWPAAVVAASQTATPIASVIASDLDVPLCTLFDDTPVELRSKPTILVYKSELHNVFRVLAVPHGCIPPGKAIAVVEYSARDASKYRALMKLLTHEYESKVAFLSVTATQTAINAVKEFNAQFINILADLKP